MSSTQINKSSSIDPSEIAQFQKDSEHWWDESGAFAPLHKLNPARIGYIRDAIQAHFGCNSLDGKSVLDVGCGGGLVCEPLARLGAQVHGLDADEQAIKVASAHADTMGFSINYKCAAVEDISDQYDCVLALEIIEHVANPAQFVKDCAERVKDGGLLILSTLNRTPKSFLAGIVAAEHILRWVPVGTHDWKKFIKPSELAAMVRACDLHVHDVSGIEYSPLHDTFSLRQDATGVNYLLSAVKP